jgi:hypothetical protein
LEGGGNGPVTTTTTTIIIIIVVMADHVEPVIKLRRKVVGGGGGVARRGVQRNACTVVGQKSEGKHPLGSPRRRWEDNIKMNLEEVMGRCGLD